MQLAKIGFWTFITALFGNVFVWAFLPALAVGGVAYLVLLGLSLVGLIIWVTFSLGRIKVWLKQRSTQFGLSLAIMALMTFVILAFVNWLAVEKNIKKDLTENQLHTLSDQTKGVLSNIAQDEEVVLRVWSTNIAGMSPNLNMRNFLEDYQRESKGRLKLEIKNPNEFSVEAEADQVRRDNIIIITSTKSGRSTRLENFSDNKGEEQLTNAIIQTLKGQKKTVCFLAGNGQPDIEDAGPQGLKVLKDNLESSNYAVKAVALVDQEKMPEDCELVINVGPTALPLDREVEVLSAYKDQGGALVSLLGPRTPAEWKTGLKERYGIELRQDVLIDRLNRNNPVIVATRNYGQGLSITEDFNLMTLFPETSSIETPLQAKDGVQVTTIVSTEGRTYAKAGDIQSLRNIAPSSDDRQGVMAIGVLIESELESSIERNPEMPTSDDEEVQSSFSWSLIPEAHAQDSFENDLVEEEAKVSRNVIFSSHLFVINGVINNGGNFDFFANTVNYLLKDEELIGIRPRDIRQTFLEITLQDIRKVWGFIFIVGGLFLVFGVRAARRKSVTI